MVGAGHIKYGESCDNDRDYGSTEDRGQGEPRVNWTRLHE